MKKETRSRETSLCLQPSSASCCYCQLRIKIPKQGQVDPKIPLLGERSTLCPDEQQVDLDRDCTFLLLRELPLIPEMSSWPRDSWRCTYMSIFIHLVDKEVDVARWYSNVLSILELAHNSCCIYEDSIINFLVENLLKIWRYSTLILRRWSFRLRNLSWKVKWVVLLEFFSSPTLSRRNWIVSMLSLVLHLCLQNDLLVECTDMSWDQTGIKGEPSCKLGCARPFCGVDWISRWRGGDLDRRAFVRFLAPTPNPCPSNPNGSVPPNFGC